MTISLTRRGWGFVLSALVSAVAAVLVELRDVWYLAAFFVAVPVAGLLTVTVVRLVAGLEVRVAATNPTPHAGETVVLTASLTHRLPFSLAVKALWLVGDEPASTGVVIPRGATGRISHRWHATQRGPAAVRVQAVLITDPLGIATAKQTCDGRATLQGALVLPQLFESVPELGESASQTDSGSQPHSSVARGSGALGGALRKYRPGDAKRMVDWKQSARQGELLVRIEEAEDARVRRVIIRTEAAAHFSRSEFEFAVSEAATIAVALLRRGDVVQLEIDDEPPLDSVDEGELLRCLAFLELKSGDYAAG